MRHLNETGGAAVAARGLRASLAALGALLMLATVLVVPAQADHVECGDIITTDTTLDSDVGPCEGTGLIVRADNITLDLNGHRVFATRESNGPTENAGIALGNVSGVTVQNGTVEGFDAGVFINRGGDNTVQGINAVNNINDMEEPYPFQPGEAIFCPPGEPDCDRQDVIESGEVSGGQYYSEMVCLLGDGITTESSSDNVIRHNKVVGNGPYGGITLVGNSDGNRVEKNRVEDNNINNYTTRFDDSEGSGLCGATLPGAPGMQRGREVQAMGIRLEGPGADDNVVEGNQVTGSALVGISIHSYVCMPAEGDPFGPQNPNEQNTISENNVSSTGDERRVADGGFVSVEQDDFADGIGSLAQGPIGRVTCTSHDNTIVDNRSKANDRHGVSLHRSVETTEVSGNVANNNGGSGVWVSETAVDNTLHRNKAHNNAEFDGYDGNPDCDNNDWMANRFKTVNQECVAAGGTGWVGGPGNSGNAPGQSGDAPGLSGLSNGRGR